ncbi:hypothetical protein A2307_05385 [Candidatus Peregrinibacteria bacterium RIFOXYB2_FULL_33_20]|nr:MAG: hypothetical protein A2263_02995 [Candidatus Peregrinibacteria bacterium RIFOXYA2_FULL_33_21]OGJ51711.1 MAG: hypothetical protein A2307_05385 [Candidatus Peregrinibacteria bacterium RIFOXYB2_FULL_33_20]
MLRGYLADDPEIKHTTTQKKVATLVLTTRRKKMENGEAKDHPDFHRLTVWQGMAETAEKYLHKGDAIEVFGEIHNDHYQGKDGKTKYVIEITVDRMDILGVKKGGKMEFAEGLFANREEEKTREEK